MLTLSVGSSWCRRAESGAVTALAHGRPTRHPAGEDGPLSRQLVRQGLAGISSSHARG